MTVAGRQTLGPRGGLGVCSPAEEAWGCAALQELGAAMGRAGQGRRDGGSDREGIDLCGWS